MAMPNSAALTVADNHWIVAGLYLAACWVLPGVAWGWRLTGKAAANNVCLTTAVNLAIGVPISIGIAWGLAAAGI
jgi:hypothetical protein